MDDAKGLYGGSATLLADAISVCESEDIRRPERIQTFGCLIASDHDGRIVGLSANAPSMLRREAPLGASLGTLLGGDDVGVQHLLAFASTTQEPASLSSDVMPGDLCTRFEVLAHASRSGAILEFIPLEPDRLLTTLPPPKDADDVFRQCLARAERVRALTGYDRVMVYRFHQDFTGEVIAEVRRPELVPYLGLRYPATDIPSQARALYLENRLRIIPNVYAPTSELVASKSVDLSMARLRAVSPYHLEYLQNMQVAATLTLSLIVDGTLWGLVACHHAKERHLSFAMQEAALAEADALSGSITALSRREAASAHRAARQSAPKWTYLLSGPAIIGPLLSGPNSIIADLRADGGAIVCGDACLALGAAPDCIWLKEAAKDFHSDRAGSIFTNRLSELAGLAATPAAAGAMIARIESEPPITLFVFRRAQIQEVHWGGDPKTAVTVSPDGKPSPRQSFALWRDLVRDRARPWSAREQNVFAACLGALTKQVADRGNIAADLHRELRAVAEGYSDMADSHRLLVDALPEGVAVLLWSVHFKTERLHYANRAFANLFGLDAADVVGRDPDHIFQRTQIDRALLECSDGEEREMDVWSSTLGVRRIRARRETLMLYQGPGGEISIDSLLLSDTTAASRSQEALLSAVRQLEAAEGARGALLRNMSHELRTPLNAIVGYSDMLAQELVGPLGDASYIAAAEEIRSAAGHLLDLINDTLEVARLKSGKARIDPSRHDVGGIVSSATRLLRELAASRRIELITDIPTTPVFAIVDDMAFRQIVINLVNNAIKFTTEGGRVDVILACEEDGSAVLSVIDTGIGIAPEEVSRLFTPFSQVDSTIGRPKGGSGLGLAIVKELIQLHGGKIEVVSVEGLGSTFTVRLPAWRVETSE